GRRALRMAIRVRFYGRVSSHISRVDRWSQLDTYIQMLASLFVVSFCEPRKHSGLTQTPYNCRPVSSAPVLLRMLFCPYRSHRQSKSRSVCPSLDELAPDRAAKSAQSRRAPL